MNIPDDTGWLIGEMADVLMPPIMGIGGVIGSIFLVFPIAYHLGLPLPDNPSYLLFIYILEFITGPPLWRAINRCHFL